MVVVVTALMLVTIGMSRADSAAKSKTAAAVFDLPAAVFDLAAESALDIPIVTNIKAVTTTTILHVFIAWFLSFARGFGVCACPNGCDLTQRLAEPTLSHSTQPCQVATLGAESNLLCRIRSVC